MFLDNVGVYRWFIFTLIPPYGLDCNSFTRWNPRNFPRLRRIDLITYIFTVILELQCHAVVYVGIDLLSYQPIGMSHEH